MLAGGALLGQLRPSATTVQQLFSAQLGTEITALFVCNTGANPRTFTIHHVPVGGSASLDNLLYSAQALPANDTFVIRAESQGAGIQMEAGDTIQVQVDAANEVNFMAYGQTQKAAERTQERIANR